MIVNKDSRGLMALELPIARGFFIATEQEYNRSKVCWLQWSVCFTFSKNVSLLSWPCTKFVYSGEASIAFLEITFSEKQITGFIFQSFCRLHIFKKVKILDILFLRIYISNLNENGSRKIMKMSFSLLIWLQDNSWNRLFCSNEWYLMSRN